MDALTPTHEPRATDTVGKSLKHTREEKNLSLDEVSRATKIKKEFLVAIEEDRIDALPGQVFARGFIRAYGEFLGMDGQVIATRAVSGKETNNLAEPPGTKAKARLVSSWALALTAMGSIAAAVALYASHYL